MTHHSRRFLLGALIIMVFWIGIGSWVTLALTAPVRMIFPDLSLSDPASEPLGFFLLAQTGFFVLLLGIYLTVRHLLGRSLTSFITSASSVRISLALRAGVIWFLIICLVSAALHLITPQQVQVTFRASDFLFFLPFVLLLTPIQCFSEELLFRSYLWRWTEGHRMLSSPWVLCPLSGVLFLAAHLGNPEISALGGRMSIYGYYLLYGAFLMHLTLADRGIEAAAGIHTANNLFALLVLNYEGSVLPSPSVLTVQELHSTSSLAAVAAAAALYLLLRRRLPGNALTGMLSR